jgi:predicted 3-demethylubiquinone-9 3-methyltransferase (glyoxalase superfamily)
MKRIPLSLIVVAALLGAWARPAAWGDAEGGAMPAQKIVPCLWFNDQAEEAVRFYCSIFPDAKVIGESRAGPRGPLVSAKFRLAGQEFLALNGNAKHPFTDASSLFVNCATQEEVDGLWAKLTADGGEPGRCGWLKDRYGVSWQIIPTTLVEMLGDRDPMRAKRVVEAMLQMGKIDIARLRQAYDGR